MPVSTHRTARWPRRPAGTSRRGRRIPGSVRPPHLRSVPWRRRGAPALLIGAVWLAGCGAPGAGGAAARPERVPLVTVRVPLAPSTSSGLLAGTTLAALVDQGLRVAAGGPGSPPPAIPSRSLLVSVVIGPMGGCETTRLLGATVTARPPVLTLRLRTRSAPPGVPCPQFVVLPRPTVVALPLRLLPPGRLAVRLLRQTGSRTRVVARAVVRLPG